MLYDFFARTPRTRRPVDELDFKAIHADFGPVTQEFHIGAGATAVPGMAAGLFAVHKDLCRLPMARLVEPAVRAARDGVEMSAFHAYLFQVISPILLASEGAKKKFAPAGTLLGEGQLYKNPDFANMLEAMAREGARLFVDGDIGQAIIRQSLHHGGHLTAKDLQDYKVRRRTPLVTRYMGCDVFFNPAPSAGGPLIAFGLAMLDKMPEDHRLDPLAMARIMQQTNRARDAHNIDELLLPENISSHLKALDGHMASYRGTTHMSVIDGEGNAAAATISNGEGNGLMVEDMGFMLNNMLGEEDLNPGGFHRWTPGRRLSSMMAPTLMREGDGGVIVLGSGGSNRIRTAVLQVICNLLANGMELEAAIDAPRLHLERCGMLSFEDTGLLAEDRSRLLEVYADAQGWSERNMFFGGVHCARRSADGEFEGAGDKRRKGVSIIVE